MRYPVMLCWVFLLSNAWAQENGDVLPASRAVVMSTAADEVSAVPAPAWVPPAERTATFVVNYTGFSAEAEAAFQYAIDIWAGLITSSIPIVVNATWEDLPGNALGSAGSTGLWYNFTGAPFNNILYPSPLADKLAGANLSPGEADINANFDSGTDWYYGLDGNTPFAQFDLVSVVLHEIGHGLGFAGTAYVGTDLNGYILNDPLPHVFDGYVWTGDNDAILTLGSGTPALGAALVSENLYWAGTQGNAYSGPFSPMMYAPMFWEPGSSFSHFDEDMYPSGSDHSLMTPFIGNGESVHSPGAMCLGVLDDIGWTVDYAALDGGGGEPGCTDATACNFDAAATLEDGSCIFPVADEPCGDCTSLWSMDANLAAGEGVEFTFGGVGTMDVVEVAVQWPGDAGGGEWISDLLVVVCDPEGDCFEWGGFDLTAGADDAGVDWPASWDQTTAGTYTASFYLAPLGLSGLGTWTITLYNGYAASLGLDLTDVTFTIPYVCPLAGLSPGCTDMAACNYDADADFNDGSCDYLCFNCGETLLAETFQGYNDVDPLTVQSSAGWDTWSGGSGTPEDPFVVFDGADGALAVVAADVDPSQGTDILFPIGASSGNHVVQFSILADPGHAAYYNFQGSAVPGVEWTLESYIAPDGAITFYHDQDSTLAAGFQFGQDNVLTHLFDLDADELRIVLGNQLIALIPYTGNLGGVNFYGVSFGGGLGAYLLDDVTVCATTEQPTGCMDEEACNFDPAAEVDDGSCWTPFDFGWCDCDGAVFDALGECGGGCAQDLDMDGVCDVPGCTDPEACNFDPSANYDNGDCTYAAAYYDCDGACLNDADGDGVCDELEVVGCTDAEACNFDADATEEDGSCAYLTATFIDGENAVDEGAVMLYVASPSQPGNQYTWAVSGGALASGQGTAIVTVEWSTPGSHGLQVVETNAACTGSVVGLDVEVNEVVGVEERQSQVWAPFPNPAIEGFRLDVEAEDVQLVGADGRILKRWSSRRPGQFYDLSGIAPGCYLVACHIAGARQVRSLLVVR